MPTIDLGPVELLVLTFDGEQIDDRVIQAVAEVVNRGDVTILDLVVVARDPAGEVRVVEIDEEELFGFEILDIEVTALTNDADIKVISAALEPGTSAVMIVFEHTWARLVARAIKDAGGEVGLHVRIPRETAEAAFLAAEAV